MAIPKYTGSRTRRTLSKYRLQSLHCLNQAHSLLAPHVYSATHAPVLSLKLQPYAEIPKHGTILKPAYTRRSTVTFWGILVSLLSTHPEHASEHSIRPSGHTQSPKRHKLQRAGMTWCMKTASPLDSTQWRKGLLVAPVSSACRNSRPISEARSRIAEHLSSKCSHAPGHLVQYIVYHSATDPEEA